MEKPVNAFVPNFLLGIAGGIQYLKLKSVSKNPRKASEKTLRGILQYAKDTVYGKEHHFEEILKAKDDKELYRLYQKYVPAQEYESLRPYVERHKQGETDILFPGKPVMYATTSGTTKEPKWVPITKVYLNSVYGKMTKVWLFNFIKNRPKVFTGKIVSIVGKVIEGYAPDGTVFGSVSGVTQRDCPKFVKKLYASPSDIFSITDYNARYYAIMRMGIERNITLIVTANPSTIVEMQNNVNEYYDQYVKDIEKGTINANLNISPEIRAALMPYFKPNPERAAELRALKEKYGRVLPKHYWPNMQILNTWKCGNTKVYLDKFKDSFPEQMLHQEFGYFSSECRFGLVLDDTNNTVLFPHFHYYEFVEEHDIESENPHYLQLHELQEGKRYCPFVTTYAGLYRYNMNDLVEVGPKFQNTPTVHMIQKVNGIVTMTGEKLHERQFIEAVRTAEKELQMPVKFFVGFADLDISAYHFYYEFENLDTTQKEAELFTGKVDEVLQQVNIEYKAKRESFRVKDPVTHRLQKESFETFKAQCIAEGARDGQFKMNLLMQDEKRHAKFKKLVIAD
ncbi:MAG: GH3 auxin-responsive promoter family protein [Paludibacteraceae bacterium]|nr:GH3 auxin-responsive promoter family protein [Paludibacteraceae bacterium]